MFECVVASSVKFLVSLIFPLCNKGKKNKKKTVGNQSCVWCAADQPAGNKEQSWGMRRIRRRDVHIYPHTHSLLNTLCTETNIDRAVLNVNCFGFILAVS